MDQKTAGLLVGILLVLGIGIVAVSDYYIASVEDFYSVPAPVHTKENMRVSSSQVVAILRPRYPNHAIMIAGDSVIVVDAHGTEVLRATPTDLTYLDRDEPDAIAVGWRLHGEKAHAVIDHIGRQGIINSNQRMRQ